MILKHFLHNSGILNKNEIVYTGNKFLYKSFNVRLSITNTPSSWRQKNTMNFNLFEIQERFSDIFKEGKI